MDFSKMLDALRGLHPIIQIVAILTFLWYIKYRYSKNHGITRSFEYRNEKTKRFILLKENKKAVPSDKKERKD